MSESKPHGGAPRLGLILLLGALTAFTPLSIDMYLPAFPFLEADFAVSAGAVQWTLSVFFLGLTVGQPIYGPVSDRYGRRGPLLLGIGLYLIGSIAAALTDSVAGLTGARFLQAFGGCAGVVVARAVVADRFDERTSAKVFSMLMLVMGIAPILAPMAGAQLLVLGGWRAIFWGLALFGLLCLAAVALGLRETLPPERRASGGITHALLAYMRLLRNRRFIAFALTGSFAMAGLFAYITGSPLVFMQIHGVSPQVYGLLFGLNALGIIAGSQINVRLLRRWTGREILAVAVFVEIFAGVALVAVAATGFGGLAGLMVPLFVYITGLGFITGNTVAAAMAEVSAGRGAASALIGVLQFGLAALVSFVLGAIQDATALPMALAIAGGAVGALAMSRVARR